MNDQSVQAGYLATDSKTELYCGCIGLRCSRYSPEFVFVIGFYTVDNITGFLLNLNCIVVTRSHSLDICLGAILNRHAS